jgi:hypothetical protein
VADVNATCAAEIREFQRKADAALIRSAGCLGPSFCGVTYHERRCPISLAERIEKGESA